MKQEGYDDKPTQDILVKGRMKIFIILGSTRKERVGDKVANWVLKAAKKETDFNVELLDLRDYDIPFFDEVRSIAYLNGEYSSKEGKRWAAKIAQADGFIIVTPEYNHGYPAVLKNAIDYAYLEWLYKPVAFVGYSAASTGASRAIEQLAQVFGQLRAMPIVATGDSVIIPNISIENNKFDGSRYIDNLKNLFTQLKWWTEATKKQRDSLAK